MRVLGGGTWATFDRRRKRLPALVLLAGRPESGWYRYVWRSASLLLRHRA